MKKIDDLISYEKVYVEKNRVFNKNFLLSDELALYILDQSINQGKGYETDKENFI